MMLAKGIMSNQPLIDGTHAPGVGKAYQVPGLGDLTEDQKTFILAHENLHRQLLGMPLLKGWDDLLLIMEPDYDPAFLVGTNK
jgi:hypothetical protein